jgi:hypothetical protein
MYKLRKRFLELVNKVEIINYLKNINKDNAISKKLWNVDIQVIRNLKRIMFLMKIYLDIRYKIIIKNHLIN